MLKKIETTWSYTLLIVLSLILISVLGSLLYRWIQPKYDKTTIIVDTSAGDDITIVLPKDWYGRPIFIQKKNEGGGKVIIK